jgi:hypothetical protein
MQKIFLYTVIIALYVSCNGAGDREYNMETKTEKGDSGTTNDGDTTSTINNNAYNPDSSSGKGTVYDTSGNTKGKSE